MNDLETKCYNTMHFLACEFDKSINEVGEKVCREVYDICYILSNK